MNKEMNKNRLIIILVAIIITLILLIIALFTIKKNEIDNNKDEINGDISIFMVETDENTIEFYKQVEGYYHVNDYAKEKPISTYTCTSKRCGYENYILDNNMYLLYDGETIGTSNVSDNPRKLILWNAIKGKEIAKFNDIVEIYTLNENNKARYILLKEKSNEVSLYDLSGKKINNVTDKVYVTESYEGKWISTSSYLTESDIIVTIKDKKHGIEKITKNETLINHKYDEIVLYDANTVKTGDSMSLDIPKLYAGKYYKARTGNKWSLYNLTNGTKVINKEYDKLYLLDETTIAVYNNGYISFIDYNGNDVCNDKIKVTNLYGWMPQKTEGIKFTISNSIVKISIDEGTTMDNVKNYNYEYNLITKTLTESK